MMVPSHTENFSNLAQLESFKKSGLLKCEEKEDILDVCAYQTDVSIRKKYVWRDNED